MKDPDKSKIIYKGKKPPRPASKEKYGHLPYRKNISAIILNLKKEVLIVTPSYFARRRWKCLSGGVDEGESEEQALRRELLEELGTNKFEIIKKSEAKMEYLWPEYHIHLYDNKFKGQSKTFFVLRFTGHDKDISLNKKENSTWRWAKQHKLPTLFGYPGQAEFILSILADPELRI